MLAFRTLVQSSRSQWRRLSTCMALRNQTEVASSAQKLQVPPPDGEFRENPKLDKIVTDIAALNLLEVSELSSLLKRRLNLPDAPMMPAFAAIPAGAAKSEEDDEEAAAPKTVKTSFNVKLMSFDVEKKIALIKEIKNTLENMNLVQAKKFVESAPVMVKEDCTKDDAEKLKEAFTKVGAVIEVS